MITFDSLTDEQKAFSFYYIALCENGGNVDDTKWNADNYNAPNDPITLGILQWASGAAAQLMEIMRDNYTELWSDCPDTWKTKLAEHDHTDYYFWYSSAQYLTWDEHVTWQSAVNAHIEDAKKSQRDMWFGESTYSESLKGYINNMYWCNTDDIKVFFYYMQCYHLSPEFASNLWQIVGDCSGDLEVLSSAAVNWLQSNYVRQWSTYGDGWTNRCLDYALTPLKDWDGDTSPNDWGYVTPTDKTGGEPSNISGTVYNGGITMKLSYVKTFGDTLIAVSADGKEYPLVTCYAGNIASAGMQATSITYSSRPTEGTKTLPSSEWIHASEAYELMRSLFTNLNYNQDDHEFDIYDLLSGDCSSLVFWTVYHVDRPTAEKMRYPSGYPGNTGVFQDVCPFVGLSGTMGEKVGDNWQPGDIMLMNLNYYSTDMAGGTSGSHVGMIFDENTVIHHGYTPGPQVNTIQELADVSYYWEIRRLPYE